MKHINEATAAIKAIPPKTLKRKIRNTVIGVAFIAGAVLIRIFDLFPVWFSMVLIAVGGYGVAGDLLRGAASFFPAAIKEVRDAFKNGK